MFIETGTISVENFGTALRSLGLTPSDEEVQVQNYGS